MRNRLPIRLGLRAIFLGQAVVLGSMNWSAPCGGQPETPAPEPPSAQKTGDDDWAREYLLTDPLATVEKVTLADLRQALADPARRDTVLPRHFARSALTEAERQTLLLEALDIPSQVVRRQAAEELDVRGWLVAAVRSALEELSQRGDADQARAARLALEHLELATSVVGDELDRRATEALGSDDVALRTAAIESLERAGAAAAPLLLEIVRSGNEAERNRAAAILARIVAQGARSRGEKPGPGQAAPAVAKFRGQTPAAPTSARKTDDSHPQVVRVHFGTNRELLTEAPDPRWRLWLLPVVALVAIALLARRWKRRQPGPVTAARGGWRGAAMFVVCLAALLWSAVNWNAALREFYSGHVGAVFGPRRDSRSQVRYGYCDVSIPPTHEVGEVEQPWLGPEDESSHVVLKRTGLLADEAFFSAVRTAIESAPKEERSCFVFVHGFYTSFETAARRTAQIKHDLQFPGAALFFSWPSRGRFLQYASDRNEIQHAYEYVRRFLLDVADRGGADRIHVVAHSTGADAVGRAIMTMGERGKIFDQIVLAAPDIDADVFREQIAPALARHARRTTLYCSQNDWAMRASYAFNDSRRAGDSSEGVVVVAGADSVDVSKIDTGLLGHSYYADCLPLLRDVEAVLGRNLPPNERKLTPAFLEDRAPYWILNAPAP